MTQITPLWHKPKITVISAPVFMEPIHMPVSWMGDSTPGEKLAEFAGRLCYMSQRNPAERTTGAYLENIMQQGHGSVLEHVNYSLLIEGVSRSLTHELVRHRAGMAYSQLSQRFVNSEDAGFVVPPSIQGHPLLEAEFERHCRASLELYEYLTDKLVEEFKKSGQYDNDPTLRRKRAREAARSVLPNSTETKLVATGNVRAWRHIITMRADTGADAEIRTFAEIVHEALMQWAPLMFQDFTKTAEGLKPDFKKV